MFSIILPVYNAECTLNRCVRSIIKQSYQDWELLLINDGSTDNSLQLCKNFAQIDGRIHVFNKDNGGVSSARNIGIENSKGEWITFCDADDWVNVDWLLTFHLYITNKTELLSQGINIVNNNRIVNRLTIDYRGKIDEGILLLAKNRILGYLVTKTFRGDLIRKNKLTFNEQFRFREDEDFILRYMSIINTIVCINVSEYNYNIPDFSKKYDSLDNFYPFIAIYSSLKGIFSDDTNWLVRNYIQEISQSLFASYSQNAKDCIEKARLFKKEIGGRVFCANGVSWVSKVVIAKFPYYITDLIFKLKSAIVKKADEQ